MTGKNGRSEAPDDVSGVYLTDKAPVAELQRVRLSLWRWRGSVENEDAAREIRAVASCLRSVAPLGRVWARVGRSVLDAAKDALADTLADGFRHLSLTLPGEPAFVVPLLSEPVPSSRAGVLTISAPEQEAPSFRFFCNADLRKTDWREWLRTIVKALGPDGVELVAERTWRFSVQRERDGATAFESGWLEESTTDEHSKSMSSEVAVVGVPGYLLESGEVRFAKSPAMSFGWSRAGGSITDGDVASDVQGEYAGTEEINLGEVHQRLGGELPAGFLKQRVEAPRHEQAATVQMRIRVGDEGTGTVLALPSKEILDVRAAHFGQRLTPARVPDLTLEQYAELIAVLEVRGANDASTLQRFGVFSVDARRALDDVFAALFAAQPDERRRFEAWVEHHRQRLRTSP